MKNRSSGLLMIALAIAMAILYFALPNFWFWIYWIVIALLLIYGIWLYMRT